MKYLFLFLFLNSFLNAQELYYPPFIGDDWDRTTLEELNWCTDEYQHLIDTLEQERTKAFILLKDGKIVGEEYFNTFTQDSIWPWFSAGKSLTSFLIGLAQDEALIDINTTSRTYLGESWSSLTDEQEMNISVLNHLTMTTGLDYINGNPFCTDVACLQFLNEAGEHWYYHNAPYSIVKNMIESSSSTTINSFTNQRLKFKIGMTGFWSSVGFNNYYFSNARSMARFGLLMLGQGKWKNNQILKNENYYEQMISSSQDLNSAYGLLWWLNGKDSYKLPGTDTHFQGALVPNVFNDMYCAIGANAQLICVIPSENIVFVRMGQGDIQDLVPLTLLNSISNQLKKVLCNSTSNANTFPQNEIKIYPNPSRGEINIEINRSTDSKLLIYSTHGQLIKKVIITPKINSYSLTLNPGIYFIEILSSSSQKKKIKKLIVF